MNYIKKCRKLSLFRFVASIIFIFCISLCSVFAEGSSVPGLYRYTLDNGLSLFVYENNSAPLAFVQIAVRTGAVSQTKENAGLFHLYEHMMFKGNAKYKNQQAITSALNKMGVSDWNGSTGIDEVNYYITVPSSLVRDGLEFWSYAVRTPLLDEKEFANEKEVVLSEINGNHTDPGHIVFGAVAKHLFSESPYRLDSGGNPDVVRNATVAQLRDIQKTFYVPNNAAVFVGGDVHHEDVYKIVCDLYGDWKKSEAEVPFKAPPSKTPFASTQKYVYPDPQISGNYVQLVYYLRGPDAETDCKDTYAADVWTNIISSPSGSFKNIFLSDKTLSIPDADYISGFYSTQRASGMICFSVAMLSNLEMKTTEQADSFLNVLCNNAIPMMAKNDSEKSWCTKKDLKDAKRQIQDRRIYNLETPDGFLSSLASMWSSAGGDYFFNYDDGIESVKSENVSQFVKKYIADKNGIVILFVNPEKYKTCKEEYDLDGYVEITEDSAFWWKN